MAVIDQVFMNCPWYGSRQMARHLQRMGHAVGRRRVRRLALLQTLTRFQDWAMYRQGQLR
jgi:hypothetical protein